MNSENGRQRFANQEPSPQDYPTSRDQPSQGSTDQGYEGQLPPHDYGLTAPTQGGYEYREIQPIPGQGYPDPSMVPLVDLGRMLTMVSPSLAFAILLTYIIVTMLKTVSQNFEKISQFIIAYREQRAKETDTQRMLKEILAKLEETQEVLKEIPKLRADVDTLFRKMAIVQDTLEFLSEEIKQIKEWIKL